MGTREVYEEKLRSGAHLHRDPTINPGLGSARCPRCLSLLNPATSSVRTPQPPSLPPPIPPPKHVKGPKWLHLLVGVPPLVLFSGASALFGAYALPTFAQLTVTSYYAASSASHYAISQITRQIEKAHLSGAEEKS
ncbi:hypothetical protein CFC21_108086 [Triticum aestivum]|uniref:Uncharacterized protein n=1 Tax=Triticum aestivum TaxID=4565 RepID=A0A9R1MI68_WHEAT|nr:hypothetical protein CFC21_108086 [Triticum aestivum]